MKISIQKSSIILAALFVGVFSLSFASADTNPFNNPIFGNSQQPDPMAQTTDCSNPATVMDGHIMDDGSLGGGALGRIQNNSDCTFNIGFESFNSDGSRYDVQSSVIGPWATADLHISVPNCQYTLKLSAESTYFDVRTIGSPCATPLPPPPATPLPPTPLPQPPSQPSATTQPSTQPAPTTTTQVVTNSTITNNSSSITQNGNGNVANTNQSSGNTQQSGSTNASQSSSSSSSGGSSPVTVISGGGGNFGGIGIGTLVINKLVRDVTSNSGQLKSVNANQGDLLQFTITVTPNGSNFINNVRVGDSLPVGLTYVPGSSQIDRAFMSDGLITSGVNLGQMLPSQVHTITFNATVNTTAANGPITLTNIASAFGDNAQTVSDNAQVVVGSVPVGQVFTIQKIAKDISRGDTIGTTSLSARSGDTVEFDLTVTAPNQTTGNIVLTDPIPLGMTYNSQSTSVNGTQAADGIAGTGLNIGTLVPGQQVAIRLFAVVNTNDPSGQVLTNIANGTSGTSIVSSNPVTVTVSNGVVLGALKVRTGPGTTTASFAGLGSLAISLGYFFLKKRALIA